MRKRPPLPSDAQIDQAKRMAVEPRINDVYPYARIQQSPVPWITVVECIKECYGLADGDWCKWIQEAAWAHENRGYDAALKRKNARPPAAMPTRASD
jgi:hypothetical protein